MTEVRTNRFANDQAVADYNADELGRKPFAAEISESILGWTCKKSLVIGLSGAWGSGKSSLKNMIKDYIRKEKSSFPIVDFNPWEWSGHADLRQSLFQEVSREMGKRNREEESRAAAAKLDLYSKYFDGATVLSEGFKAALPLLILTALIGGLSAWVFASLNWIIGALIFFGYLAATFKRMGAFFASASKALEADVRTLQDIRKELTADLEKIPAPVLIIVDEIDRLSSEEIRAVFQLVKANLNFPNLIFFLLYDTVAVSHALDDPKEKGSREYISKIVQVEFSVPSISPTILKSFLRDQFLDSLATTKSGKVFDAKRWNEVYDSCYIDLIKTLRDAKRLINSYQFHLAVFNNSSTLEVNPIDLLTLEVLRIFTPTVHERLFEEKSLLAPEWDIWSIKDTRKFWIEKFEPVFDQIFAKAPQEKIKVVKSILADLFPAFRGYIEVKAGGEKSFTGFVSVTHIDHDRLLRDVRIGHPDLFDRYFYSSKPVDEFSQHDTHRLLEAINDSKTFLTIYTELRAQGFGLDAIKKINAYREEIAPKNADDFLASLFRISEIPPPNASSDSFYRNLEQCIFAILRKIESSEHRLTLLLRTMADSNSLYLSAVITDAIGRSVKENGEFARGITDQDGLDQVVALLCAKIRSAAKDGSLRQEPFLYYLLGIWIDCAPQEECKTWFAGELVCAAGIIALVDAYAVVGEAIEFRYQLMAKIIALNSVRDAIQAADLSGISDADKLLVDSFLKRWNDKTDATNSDEGSGS